MVKNNIVAAIRNFQDSNLVASYGANLAKRLDRKLTLISATEISILPEATGVTGAGMINFEHSHIQQAKSNLEINLNRLCLKTKIIWPKTNFDAELGSPEVAFIEKAKQESPFLVLIEGNSKMTNLREWFGTYETRLAENINAPTLVLSTDQKWSPVNNILRHSFHLVTSPRNKGR